MPSRRRYDGVTLMEYGVPHLRYDKITRRSRGRLPHWDAENAIYSVVFRLVDSLPQSVLEGYKSERERLMKRVNKEGLPLSQSEQQDIENLFSERIDQYLDSGAGNCWLAKPEVATIVWETIHRFNNDRYCLFATSIMPNHVHAVLQPTSPHTRISILHTWKSYTSHAANKVLNQSGTFWQKEPYDHLIRNQDDLIRAIRYVLDNPKKANLHNWPWVWARETNFDKQEDCSS
jgi:REP element-mobilizing transposase RayT